MVAGARSHHVFDQRVRVPIERSAAYPPEDHMPVIDDNELVPCVRTNPSRRITEPFTKVADDIAGPQRGAGSGQASRLACRRESGRYPI